MSIQVRLPARLTDAAVGYVRESAVIAILTNERRDRMVAAAGLGA